MTERRVSTRRRLGLSLAALAILLSACGGSGASAAPTADASLPAGLAEVDVGAASTAGPTEPAKPQAPPDVLAAAISMLGDSYLFESQVMTPSGDQVFVSGTRVGESFAYRVETGGAIVDAVVIGTESWIRDDGSDEWLTSETAPFSDPLAALAQPSALSSAASVGQLLATYEAGSIDPNLDGTLDVLISIDGNAVSFDSVSDNLELRTVLTASAALAEIIPPT